MLRNRWPVLGIPVLVVVAAAGFTSLVTPMYEATTTIEITQKRSPFSMLESLEQFSSEGSRIGTEMQILRSRTLAEEVVDSLGLQLTVRRPRRVPRGDLFSSIRVERSAPSERYTLARGEDGRYRVTDRKGRELGAYAVGEPIILPGARVVLAPGAAEYEELQFSVAYFQDAVKGLRQTAGVGRPSRDADLVEMRYESSDPELVHRVPNSMAGYFIRARRSMQKVEALSTIEFLNEQIVALNIQLRAAEDSLRAFREGERIVSLDAEAKEQVRWLANLQGERDLLDAERKALAEMMQEARDSAASGTGGGSVYRRMISFPTLIRNFAVSELYRSLAEVENQQAELLSRRTLEDPDVQVLAGRVHQLEGQLQSIVETYLEGLSKQVRSMDENLDRFRTDLAAIPANEVRFARLFRQTELLEEIYTLLQTRLKETEIIAAVEDGSVRVIDPAIEPMKPFKPRLMLNLALGVMLGVILGVGLAFLRENMDVALQTREDLQSIAPGVPVLGVIPRIRKGKAFGPPGQVGDPTLGAHLVVGRDPRNPVSEAYRSLRTNIIFSRPERVPKTLVLTSPTPGDGKSTSSANLALTLAQQGVRCLLVDADLRRGVLNAVFGIPREPGLTNILFGNAKLEEAVRSIELGEGVPLDVLGTGTIPPNPAELLASERMQALLQELSARYDTVILDAPPLNLVTDAALLGTYADGVVLVSRAGVTARNAVAFAVEQLTTVRAPLLGTVLNDIDQKKEQYYGSYSAGAHASYYGAPAGG
jgi:tyrosine-protein kinase Etk/Wzc